MSEAWPPDQRRSRPRFAGDRPSAAAQASRAAGDRSRDAILHAAASLATQDGQDGPSAGMLAAALSMSQPGRPSRTTSKQELQLATVAEAARIFDEEVVQPALAAPPGLRQLAAVCEAFFAHLERHTVPGGCFMASAALEMGTRPGPVKDMIASVQAQFGELIRGFAATAMARNELPAGEDPDRLAFELNGIMLATDTNFAQHDDPAVLDLARQIVRQRLGVSEL
jgi:AcrR family transcriptional regulator